MIGKITFLSGPDRNRVIFFRNILTIGRNRNNDLRLESPSISRQHAKICFKKDSFVLSDLKSQNGTFLNDKIVVGQIVLKKGDIIRISAIDMRFEPLREEDVDPARLNKIFVDYAQSAESLVTGPIDLGNAKLESIYKRLKRQPK